MACYARISSSLRTFIKFPFFHLPHFHSVTNHFSSNPFPFFTLQTTICNSFVSIQLQTTPGVGVQSLDAHFAPKPLLPARHFRHRENGANRGRRSRPASP